MSGLNSRKNDMGYAERKKPCAVETTEEITTFDLFEDQVIDWEWS